MSDSIYKKLKAQNGERFAQAVRNHHSSLLDIPDLVKIVRYAGRDAVPLLPYLRSLLEPPNNASPPTPGDPFALLDQAGYNAFHANTLEKQNSIKRYFKKSELLCTFNDSARYHNYHIVHAVKKNVDDIKRDNFNGREARQDAYGTSVISIQMLKSGGFISIKNRYNHTVTGSDNTFDSNPDNIAKGLTSALKAHFNVDFSTTSTPLPYRYVLIGNHIFKYHDERDNVYYGDQAWSQDGVVYTANRGAGDALFEGFLFDNKTKTLKKIGTYNHDKFADNFNRFYGGSPGLNVDKQGNLRLNTDILIGAEQSRIKTIDLPAITELEERCLTIADALTYCDLSSVISIGNECFGQTGGLLHFKAPLLTKMGDYCFFTSMNITDVDTPALIEIGAQCFRRSPTLTHFNAPNLKKRGSYCFEKTRASIKYTRLPDWAKTTLSTLGM